MIRLFNISWCVCAVALVSFVALSGCQQGVPPQKKGGHNETDHEAGPHGGPLAEWQEKYHAEFTVDHKTKQVTLYVLDETTKKAPKIEPSKITKVKIVVEKPALTIELKHNADKSGDQGIAFVSDPNDAFATPAELKMEISAVIDGTPFHDPKVNYTPKKDKAAALRDLYLKPGGLYTEADIKANGTTTAGEKYKGKEWHAHDDSPQPGDKICPISKSKADKECVWTIQGQTYEFCCTPCIDRFMRLANEHPEKVKNADQYKKM